MTPRGPFNWTAEDVMRFLKERDFKHIHTRGSHLFYVGKYGGQFRQVSIPFHGTRALKPRTLKSIMLQSGISKDEWLK
ncbi:type II toxin-antitoxin system HicA family toxin [Patescibacteria group bacterium]|nr:type II toxin-antitoxin system HicA family toxin [Patescibacteria group bacterium]MBU1448755.1 type II toxin-antitoxin system HicA family toxin [Patescibacteria group bacterium]MBU2613511.1 type II toxin-antitoxin system HicA family toxin [Patescibacteria group bacterium]